MQKTTCYYSKRTVFAKNAKKVALIEKFSNLDKKPEPYQGTPRTKKLANDRIECMHVDGEPGCAWERLISWR